MPSPTFIIPLAAVGGLCLGSFLNVVAHRLPAGISLATPPSACPRCDAAIKPYDNVPVLSWLVLRGRCRSCNGSISPRYPLTEALTAALFAAVVAVRGDSRSTWLALIFVAALVTVTRIDLEHRIIPNRILAPLAAAAIILTALIEPHQLPERLLAATAAGGLLLAAALAYPGGMGMGDVKLAAVMGLVLGRAVAPALIVALLAGTLAGIAVMARHGIQKGRRTAIPFAPFLALGGLVGLFAGRELIDAYVHGFGS
jgi:leader peptidase (prepilin peptidase) / N-methyltransferase